MIESTTLYLFILAFIATFFHIVEIKSNFKLFKYIPAYIMIYIISALFSLFNLFSESRDIYDIYMRTKLNLFPAMIFLMLLQVDFKTIFRRDSYSIGCACSMGSKRYWSIITLGAFISILSQIFAQYFVIINLEVSTILISFVLGIVASFTRLRYLNGSKDVATTMFYIIVALLGSQLEFY